MDNTIVVSTPPHVKSKRTTRGIMIDVCISLLPCAVAGCVYFGWQALLIILTCALFCPLTEFVYFFIANKGFAKKCKDAKAVCGRFIKQFDFTSVVTGLILALILPASQKWYEVLYEAIIGSIFAIAIVKMVFGGTGKNIVNPAAAARVFMTISFLASMTSFTQPNFMPIISESNVIVSGATNLHDYILSGNGNAISALDLFLGTGVAGCIGETCKLAIIVGYIYLCVRKVIKWWQPLLMLGVFGLTATCLSCITYGSFDISLFLPHILSGGVMFAAVFMFPDYVTSPKGVWGQLLYYIAGAILIAVLRHFTKYEVASYVILLMNLFVPLIDRYLIRKPFGYKREKKHKKEGK